MKYDVTHNDTRLELRVMELEDTVATLIRIVGTMNSMLGSLNEIVAHYADNLGGLILSLPSTAPKHLNLWTTAATPPETSGRKCACRKDTPHDTP